MARLSKNGLISGAVANLVFVNQGDRNIIRSKPDTIRQSDNTKKAAKAFGYISRQDALYRRRLMHLCGLTSDDRYAYRHRASMHKMAVRLYEGNESTVSLLEGNPKMLEGFVFNRHTEWQNVCRFFPDIHLDIEAGILTVRIPELVWKRDLKPPKKMIFAKLRFMCIAALPDEAMGKNVVLLSEFVIEASIGKHVPENIFSVEGIPEGHQLFVIGEVQFQQAGIQVVSPHLRTAGTYLWGGKRVI